VATLATGSYTAAQTEAQLRADHAQVGCRFDVLAPDGGLLGSLIADDADAGHGVTKGKVVDNPDRAVKRTVAMTMLPARGTLGGPFSTRLRPWFRLGMPDGGIAEWPVGVFVWHGQPKREVGPHGEVWTLELGDKGDLLDLGGPGIGGWSISAGTLVTDAIGNVLDVAGVDFTDRTGISASSSTVGQALSFPFRDDKGKVTSWRTILQRLHEAAGFYGPWFDGSGRYMATAVPDFVTAPSTVTFEPGVDSILLPNVDASEELTTFANRIIAFSVTPDGPPVAVQVTLEDLLPGHPMAKPGIGFYVDDYLEVEGVTDPSVLTSAATASLRRRFARYSTLELQSLAWPVMETWGIADVRWPGDPEIGTTTRYHSGGWELDLLTGQMRHKLRRSA
jgi:hypothetical protein